MLSIPYKPSFLHFIASPLLSCVYLYPMTLKEAEDKYLNKIVRRRGLSYRIYNIIELGPWAKVRSLI